MTFEEHFDEFAKGQRELQQADIRLTNALNYLAEVHATLTEAQAKYETRLDESEARLEKNELLMSKNQSLMTQVLEALARLANTAAAHEFRISQLEGG